MAAALFLLGTGCNPTVEAFHENERHYSLFGYLNATADTQFIRVEPLRDGMLVRAPVPLDATVTLTHIGTGRTVSLQDSLFRFRDQANAHIFYTTHHIEPRASYRLVVRGPDEAVSRVAPTVPDTFPSPTVLLPTYESSCNGDLAPALVEIGGIDRLVAVKALYYRENPTSVWASNYLPDTLHTREGPVRAQIDYGKDICNIPIGEGVRRVIPRIELVVAAGAPDWPRYAALNTDTKKLPEGASNVEGGIGYVGGIVTDTTTLYPRPTTEPGTSR